MYFIILLNNHYIFLKSPTYAYTSVRILLEICIQLELFASHQGTLLAGLLSHDRYR